VVGAFFFLELKREAGAATTRGFRLRIVHLERSADQVIDKINFRSGHVVDRNRVDQNHSAIAADHEVIVGFRMLHVEFVLKARAASAFNADAQHGPARLTFQDFADASCGPFADRDVCTHPLAFSGLSYWQIAQRIVKCAG